MRICDTIDHGRIVFEDQYCKACKALYDLEEQIKKLEDVNNDLNSQINDLQAELEEAQRG